jgi:hypothetical protein
MAAITSDTLAHAILKLIAARTLPILRPNFMMSDLVTKDFDTENKQQGDTVTIQTPAVMTANVISETGSVVTQNPAPGNTELVLDTHAEASFVIPDVVKAINNPGLINIYLEPAVVAIATKIETDLLSLYSRFTRNTAVGAGNTALTEAVIDSAETTLFDAYVPESARKVLMVSSAAYSDLRKISRFSENQTNGDGSAIKTGRVGTIKNFEVYRSQLVQKVSTTTYNLAFNPQAIGLLTRRLPSPLPGTGGIAEYIEDSGFGMRLITTYNGNTLAQQYTVDVLYGTGVLRDQFAVNVLS